MRTLVISDLHLGNRRGHDVLRRPAALEALLGAVESTDRLVLLGDVAELRHRHAERSMAVAEPVLRAIGARLAGRPAAEVILVPGNHDRPLIRPWLREHGSELGAATAIDPTATPALARVTGWLAPVPVRVSYPGVWLDQRTYATHGHYLDRHLVPDSAFGLPRGWLGPTTRQRLGAAAYEWRRGGRTPREGSRLAGGVEGVLRRAANLLLPVLPRLLERADLTAVSVRLLDIQMRRAAAPALVRVVGRLGIEADTVIFGHVHRLGPLPADRERRWPSGPGGAALLNTGAWLYEPLLLGAQSDASPYWPGGAITIDGDGPPHPVNLLAGMDRDQLVAPT